MKGYEVESTKTGPEAIKKSKLNHFNLAVSDIKLPDMEEVDLLSERAHSKA